MTTHRSTFPNARGVPLSARLELPADGAPIACVLFAHCFTCSKNLSAAVAITRALTELEFAVLRFDVTGLGETAGDFGQTTFGSTIDDLVEAAEYLGAEIGAPEILIGHSLGGAAVLCASKRIPSARVVATIGAPAEVSRALHLFDKALEDVETMGRGTVTLGGRTFTIGSALVDDLRAASMQETIRELGRPLLIFHSPTDTIVPIEHATRIFSAAQHPKSLVSLDEADHLLTRRRDAQYVAGVLAAWAARYLGAALHNSHAAN